MRQRLTDRRLQSLKPPATGRLVVTDTDAPGLQLRVTAGGERTWSMRYRVKAPVEDAGGKARFKGSVRQQRVTIGVYPGMGLGDARDRARQIRNAAKQGVDLPAEEARAAEEQRKAAEAEARRQAAEAKRPQTLGELLTRYIDDYAKTSQRRWTLTERLFDQHVRPTLGDKPLAALRRADLVELLDDLQNEKGLAAQVNRVRSQLVAALNWAIEREYLSGNPAAGIKRRKVEKPRARVLSDAELRAIWTAADALSYPSGPLVKALILSGQRRDEVRCMARDEVRDEGKDWIIPAGRNKGKRDHLVPLSPAMKTLLEGLPQRGPFVFTTDGKKPYGAPKRLKAILDRKSGVTGWVLHDIRRTVSSRMSALGIPREIVRRVLNHAKPKLDQVYDVYEYRPEKEQALKAWAERVARLVGEGEGGNVVALVRPAPAS